MPSFRPGPPSAFFQNLPKFIIDKVVKPAGQKAAQKGEQVAKSKARRDTGAMADGTHFEFTGERIEATNDTDYWYYHEYGTVHISAQPFMEPGMKEAQTTFLDECESNFKGLKF